MIEIKDTNFSHLEQPDENTQFINCQFHEVRFPDLVSIAFEQCAFMACSFASISASDVRFERCQFYDRDNETGCNFKFSTLRDTHFKTCDLGLANLSRTGLYLSSFHDCQLSGADFTSATSEHTIGHSVLLSEFTMTDCNLAYADLSGASLPQADLSGSRFSHTQMRGVNLEEAILTECEMHNIEADNVILKGADLRGATIHGLDIRNFDVTDIKIDAIQAQQLLETLGMVVST